MTTLSEWMRQVDMPQNIHGVWVDLETGFLFEDTPAQRKKLADGYAAEHRSTISTAENGCNNALNELWAKTKNRDSGFTELDYYSAKRHYNVATGRASAFMIEPEIIAELPPFVGKDESDS